MHCQDGSILFAMGETGTMWNANIDEKLAWVNQLTSAETANAMPNYVGGKPDSAQILPAGAVSPDTTVVCRSATWFNYDKEQKFELWESGKDWDNSQTQKWMQSGTVASGARMGGGTA